MKAVIKENNKKLLVRKAVEYKLKMIKKVMKKKIKKPLTSI